MRLPQGFDPIEVGEIDNFAFDFTLDMGGASMVSTSWACQLAPYQTVFDGNAQSHVISATTATTVQIRSPIDGSLISKTGFFSVALIGAFLAPQAGATYNLEATANLTDGRVLKLNSTVLVKLPGP